MFQGEGQGREGWVGGLPPGPGQPECVLCILNNWSTALQAALGNNT